MRMRSILLSCVVCPFVHIFPHYLINGTIFGKKKVLLNIQCVFWFSIQILSETFLILGRTEWDIIINVYWSSCNRYCSQVSTKLKIISTGTQISNVMKIRRVGAGCSLRTDGRTDRQTDLSKILASFRKFAKACKNTELLQRICEYSKVQASVWVPR